MPDDRDLAPVPSTPASLLSPAVYSSEELEQMRQQFDSAPYPRIPLEKSPTTDLDRLYIHNLVTPYYLRNQQVIDPSQVTILDAGCGTGYTTLTLAAANPGATIVGIDLSAESVRLAKKRLQYHGLEEVEFHALAIEDLPHLGLQFDYINSDEVLYLLPNLTTGLEAMAKVLKPQGIIRANLHSTIQREPYHRAQEMFHMMGLMEGATPEIAAARDFMRALKDSTSLKALIWRSNFETDDERVHANCLLQGDKGFTIPQVFAALEAVGLEFISMIQWRQWELMDLFKAPEEIPPFLALSLPEASLMEKLHLFELLHPIHRLIDFWAGHTNQQQEFIPVLEWTEVEWWGATVHLHPQLREASIKQSVTEQIIRHQAIDISLFLSAPTTAAVTIENTIAAALLPLWDGPQAIPALVHRFVTLRPVDPVTLEPITTVQAFREIRQVLTALEVFLYVLLQK